jgi:hypothetical protein
MLKKYYSDDNLFSGLRTQKNNSYTRLKKYRLAKIQFMSKRKFEQVFFTLLDNNGTLIDSSSYQINSKGYLLLSPILRTKTDSITVNYLKIGF